MKPLKSTNYFNTFIAVSPTCKKIAGTIPPEKAAPTNARMQWEMIQQNPYKYTSDEVLFEIHNQRHAPVSVQNFFGEKHQPCFRCSPLPKNYGWGVHYDAKGRMAIYGAESPEYQVFLKDESLEQRVALASKR